MSGTQACINQHAGGIDMTTIDQAKYRGLLEHFDSIPGDLILICDDATALGTRRYMDEVHFPRSMMRDAIAYLLSESHQSWSNEITLDSV